MCGTARVIVLGGNCNGSSRTCLKRRLRDVNGPVVPPNLRNPDSPVLPKTHGTSRLTTPEPAKSITPQPKRRSSLVLDQADAHPSEFHPHLTTCRKEGVSLGVLASKSSVFLRNVIESADEAACRAALILFHLAAQLSLGMSSLDVWTFRSLNISSIGTLLYFATSSKRRNQGTMSCQIALSTVRCQQFDFRLSYPEHLDNTGNDPTTRGALLDP